MNRTEAIAALTAPGEHYELVAVETPRGPVRAFKHAPPTLRELFATNRVTAYIGFDSTASSLHVGTLIPVMALVQLQRAGLAAADAPVSADGTGRPADPRAFEDACAQAARPLAAFLLHHLGRLPRSVEFAEQVGAPR